MLIDANRRAHNVISSHLNNWMGEEDSEYAPLIFEALAFDFVFLDHGI